MTDRFQIIQGDVIEVLRTLPAESVHCCVTSPPYWGLRDYGTGQWDGGDPTCDHKIRYDSRADRPLGKLHGGHETIDAATAIIREQCPKCGARRVDKQIGLERTVDEYVAKMVDVFGEVRRVLHPDGTLWLNLGDSYCSTTKGSGGHSEKQDSNAGARFEPRQLGLGSGLKPKDLAGVPWRTALALQADGWWLRSDICWYKPNAMPESVTDRPSKAHEYVFLLAKNQRYYYDAEAIAEPAGWNGTSGNKNYRPDAPGRRVNDLSTNGGGPRNIRNKRSVWTISTYATREAHFATYAIELPELCIRAGSPENGLVLDPFSGAATTGLACLKTNRRYLGIELNPEYVEMAFARARKYYPLLLAA